MPKKMGVLDKVLSPFFKKNKITDWGLVGNMKSSIGNFALKTTSLNNSYEAEKALVSNLVEQVNQLLPLENINAVKFEQDILIKLTEVSSACDTLLSTGRDDDFKKHLSSLEMLIKQRMAMKD